MTQNEPDGVVDLLQGVEEPEFQAVVCRVEQVQRLLKDLLGPLKLSRDVIVMT